MMLLIKMQSAKKKDAGFLLKLSWWKYVYQYFILAKVNFEFRRIELLFFYVWWGSLVFK